MPPPARGNAMGLASHTSAADKRERAENRATIAISSKSAGSYFIRTYRSSLPAFFGLLLFVIGLLIYRPILPGSFIMDDLKLVQWDNPILNGTATPGAIWFRADFPLSTLVFWLEWKAWALDPMGYHLINIGLHALSGFLLWLVLTRLRIPGAGLAALLFMAHPVCVGTVARIAELKNTLSMPFFLLSAWAYLGYERTSLHQSSNRTKGTDGSHGGTAYYFLSLVTFVLALLAKTSVIMLPAALLGCALWQRGRIAKSDFLHTAPHFALSLGFGAMSAWFQKFQALGGESLGSQSIEVRIGTAAHAVCFYLQKACWPANLNIIYPRWPSSVMGSGAWLCVFLLCAVGILSWLYRYRGGRHILFGLFAFIAILFPALGFFDAQFMRNWQVSDHLQYAAMIVPIAAIAATVASAPWAALRIISVPVLVGTLAFASHERSRFFQAEETLLRDAVARNPAAWAAHNDLGCLVAQKKNIPEAIGHFEHSLRHNPDFPDAHLNLGQALLNAQRPAEAETHFAAVLRHNPAHADAHRGLARILIARNRRHEALLHFRAALHSRPDAQTFVDLAALLYQNGDVSGAISVLRRAVDLKPDHMEANNNLAWLLATSAEPENRNGIEAVQYARKACLLAEMKDPRVLGTLAAAYAETGRFDAAVRTSHKAISIAESSADRRSASILRQMAGLYGNGMPYHEPPSQNKMN